MYEESNSYLRHYGTPGMRWGQRKKILEGVSSGTDAGKRIANLAEKVGKKKKDLSNLSDDELRKRVSRLNLEQQYRTLSSVDKSRGAEITRNILEGIGATVAVGASVASILMSIHTLKGNT